MSDCSCETNVADPIYVPQDALMPEIIAAVRQSIAHCAWMRRRFEESIAGNEQWFSAVDKAVRDLGFQLVPTAPKGDT